MDALGAIGVRREVKEEKKVAVHKGKNEVFTLQ